MSETAAVIRLDYKPTNSAPYPALTNPRYKSLDLWRGVACFFIVIMHASFFARPDLSEMAQKAHPIGAMILKINAQMWIGVPMFFVISGYCIAATADSSRRKDHPTWHYFKRRFHRIFPPYWIALLIVLAIGGITVAARSPMYFADLQTPHTMELPPPQNLAPSQWIGSFSLTERWRWHLAGPEEKEILPPAWTLCYEEQFYAVCGLILLLARRRFFSASAIVSLGTIFTFWLWATHPNVSFDGFFFDGRWLMFAAGVLVYYHLNYQPCAWRKWVVPAILVASLAACKAIPKLFSASISYPVEDMFYTIGVGLVFAIAILLLRPMDDKLNDARFLLPLRFCGRMCYSLYLIHWIVCAVLGRFLLQMGVHGIVPTLTVTAPILIAASVGISWVFHLLVERRFLNSPTIMPAGQLATPA